MKSPGAAEREGGDLIERWLSSWLRAGLDYEAFWHRTPREVEIILDAAVERARDRHEMRRAVSYELARLMAFAVHEPKNMPDLSPLAWRRGERRDETPKSNEADQARVRAWFIAMALQGENECPPR